MESGPVPEADVTGLGIGLPLVLFTSTTCEPAGRFSYCAEIEYPRMDWKLMIGEAISKPCIPELIFSPTPSGLVGSSIGQEKRALLKERGLETWTLSNTQLKAMVGRFTMFTHKKIAAELGNFEVEDSVDSGEVTLF